VKKDTYAIKKKIMKTMNPSDVDDEEEEKSIKVKNAKQTSINTKIDDLEHQNDIISNEFKNVEHQNELVKSCCADIEERLNAIEVISQTFDERIEFLETFCEDLLSKINELIAKMNLVVAGKQ
jgi:archaellum component FlaC